MTTKATLWAKLPAEVRTAERVEGKAEEWRAKADEALAAAGYESLGAMRYHFTADPANEDRVSYAEYARQTKADRTNVRKSALAYADANGLEVAAPRDRRGGTRAPRSEVTTAKDEAEDEAEAPESNVRPLTSAGKRNVTTETVAQVLSDWRDEAGAILESYDPAQDPEAGDQLPGLLKQLDLLGGELSRLYERAQAAEDALVAGEPMPELVAS